MGAIATVWGHAIEVLLPSRCVGCGAGGTYLCDACLGRARRVGPMAFDPADRAFDEVTAPLAYEGTARTAVHRLKYSGLRAIAPSMARPMAEALSSPQVRADVIVPVPLHPSRLRQRGFNQALLLARPVAEAVGLPVRDDLLRRLVAGTPQVDAGSIDERRANVDGAFGLAPGASVAGLRIVLVDDVLTTGSTLDAAAGALKRGGARSVHALAFAREQ
ncbi:MAG: ComF family protein [Chloroflexi bacterium]|nr:ComF family protein [Chloroflexota bacterium]